MSWNADNTAWESGLARLRHLGNGQWEFRSADLSESLEIDGANEGKYAGKLTILWESGQLQTYYNSGNAGEYGTYSGSQTGTYTFTGNGSATIRIGYSYPWNGGSGNPGRYTFTETTISNEVDYPENYRSFGIDIPELNPDNPVDTATSHTITVKGMDASHNVLATDTYTLHVGPSAAPAPILLTTPHSCGDEWDGNPSVVGQRQQWRMVHPNNINIMYSGDDQNKGGGAYVWVEGSGFTSTSQVINALTTLMPTYWYGYNRVVSVIGDWMHPQSGTPVGTPLVWSNATVTDGKLTGVCIDSGYTHSGEEDEDNNGELIRKSAIAVGNNGVAYFMPSQPIFERNVSNLALVTDMAGPLLGFGLTENAFMSQNWDISQLATMEEVFQQIRDTNDLASSVDFAVVITYGNGEYGQY